MPSRPDRLPAPVSLSERLARDLGTIARVLDHARGFPAVSPGGWVGLGLVALALGPGANGLEGLPWLAAWIGVAAVAAGLGGVATLVRARREGFELFARGLRDFWSLLGVPFAAGLVLTALAAARGELAPLPGTWLLCYGFGISAAATWCRSAVRPAGLAFVVLGLVAFGVPELGRPLLLAGFGGVHLVTGLAMARRDARG